MTMGAASAAVVLTMQPRQLMAGGDTNGGDNSPAGSGNDVVSDTPEYAYTGEYRFYTKSDERGGETEKEIKFIVDDSSIFVLASAELHNIKAAVKNWVDSQKGSMRVYSDRGSHNQITNDSNTEIHHDIKAVAVLTLPQGMVWANPLSSNADPAKSWKKINKVKYDERIGEKADPNISQGPEDKASTTVTKPDSPTNPGLWITATTTPTSYNAKATFLWSTNTKISLGATFELGVWKIGFSGTVGVEISPAPVSITCDLFHRADTVLQVKKDKYMRTRDKDGVILTDWELVEVGTEWVDA
jgi:hypothetical protein